MVQKEARSIESCDLARRWIEVVVLGSESGNTVQCLG